MCWWAKRIATIVPMVLLMALGACTGSPQGSGETASGTARAAGPSVTTPSPSQSTSRGSDSLDPADIVPDPEGDALALAGVSWSDGTDGVPALDFQTPFFVTGPVARVVEDGDGAVIGEGDTVSFNYAMYAGNDRSLEYSTYDSGNPEVVSVRSGGMSQAFADALIGRHVGAKIVYARIDSSGIKASDTFVAMLMAVVVADSRTPLERASGQAVTLPGWLPPVTVAANGRPSVGLPIQAGAPRELVSEYLIRGTGAALASSQTAIVKFSAWLWDGTEFDSTWDDEASMAWRMTQEETMPGLYEGLIGRTIGSQVMVIIPPSKGFGDLAMEGVPPGSTLVYVIDLLDAQ
jgi:peptidylprolyl isomerase